MKIDRKPTADEPEFECGHVPPGDADEFSRYEDGLVAHEAGHVLYRCGEYGTALKCMEFASHCGIVWADDDVAVIEEVMERAEPIDDSRVGGFQPPAPRADMRHPMRTRRGFRRATTVLTGASLAVLALLYPQVTRLAATDIGAPQQTSVGGMERFDALILHSESEVKAQRVRVIHDQVTSSVASSAPPPTPSPAAASADTVASNPVDGTAVALRAPNGRGGMSIAFVPRENGAHANESRMRWDQVSSSRFVATLQSSKNAECIWEFRGNDGPKPEYRSFAVAVEPGSVKRVEIPLRRWRDMTAAAKTDAPAGGCLMVDPEFLQEGKQAQDAPSPGAVSTAEDPWLASRDDPSTPITPASAPTEAHPVTSSAMPTAARPGTSSAPATAPEHRTSTLTGRAASSGSSAVSPSASPNPVADLAPASTVTRQPTE